MHTDRVCESQHSQDPPALIEEMRDTAGSFATSDGKRLRENLVALLRGFFVCPVISALGELGITERMLSGAFSVSDFDDIKDKRALTLLFQYLYSIGLLSLLEGDKYVLTVDGKVAVSRDGAFSLLTSYAAYLDCLPALVRGDELPVSVNRLRNVRGSGQLHSKKFFPVALGFLDTCPPEAVLDIGCGDGCFLEHVTRRWRSIDVIGLDASATAVNATRQRLQRLHFNEPMTITADGFDVSKWNDSVPDRLRTTFSLVISLWFVAHEFSKGSPGRIIDFFGELHNKFPFARVILGEINYIPAEVLAEDHKASIMPEYLLFHELSRQGVLRWDDWQAILRGIPYTLEREKRFDEVRSQAQAGVEIPASFVWLLRPAD